MIAKPRTLRAGILVLTLCLPWTSQAQNSYPNRPIRVIVPFPPGGVVDALTRTVADKLASRLGQPIIIENKPGASGNIGAEIVATAKPDGYTLLSAPPPPLVVNQSLFAQLPFDPTKFVPVTVLASAPNLLVVHPKVRADTVAALIADARANPGKLNYASTGSGGTPHLTTEWFKSASRVDLAHVPYKGAQAYPALLSGEVDMMFMNLADALPHLRVGRLKALAVASEKRSAALPDVPTVSDTLPGFISVTWYAMAATPGTPIEIAEKLSAEIAQTLRLPDVAQKLAGLHLDPIGGSPAQTAAFFKAETERWGTVIRTARIKAD